MTLTDILPEGVVFVSATSSQGTCEQAGGIVNCNLGNLANRAAVTVTIVVKPTRVATITNIANVVGNEPDPNTANNTATQGTTVNPLCATDVTAQVRVTRGGLRYDRKARRYRQVVTLRNISKNPIQGPVSLVLDHLSSNATLTNKTGDTTCTTPQGSPYINVSVGSDNVFSPRERARALLEFSSPSRQGITYGTRLLAGSGAR